MNQPYYQQQPQQVQPAPVSVTHLNQQYFQPNLPHQICFVPQLQVLPHVQQILPQLTGQLMLDLQSNAHLGPHRTFFFNLMADNYYQNRQFMEMVNFAADLYDLYVSQHRMQQQQAFQLAIERTSQVFLASRSLTNQQLMQGYLNPQMINDFQLLVQEARALAQDITALKNSRMQQGGYPTNPGMQSMAVPPSYQPHHAGAMSYAVPNNPGGNRPSAMSAAAPVQPTPASWNMQQQPVQIQPIEIPSAPRRYEMGAVSPAGAMPVSAVVNLPPGAVGTVAVPKLADQPAPAAEPRQRARWGRGPAEPTAPAPTTSTVAIPAEPQVSGTYTYDQLPEPTRVDGSHTTAHDSRPFDLIHTDDGTRIAPAYQVAEKPEWKFRPTLNNPYRIAYDPSMYLLTLVKSPIGEVNEVLVEWTSEMDYLKHELNPKLREQEQQRRDVLRQDRPIYNWSVINALQPNPAKSMSAAPKEDEEAGMPEDPSLKDVEMFRPEVGQVRIVGTLAQGVNDMDKLLKLEGRRGLARDTYELYFDIPTVLVLPDEGWRDTVVALASATTFDDLHAQFVGFMELDDPDTVRELDQRITVVVNAAVREGLNLKLSIDSFMTDWADLRATLLSRYGDEYIDKLNDESEVLIASAFNVMDTEQTGTYLASLGYVGEEVVAEESGELPTPPAADATDAQPIEPAPTPDKGDEVEEEVVYVFTNVVVLVERISVTTVPMTREEMSLNLDTGALVVEHYQPALHSACQAIRERTVDHPIAYAHRYLLTSDRKLIELKTGIAVSSALLLFDRGQLS